MTVKVKRRVSPTLHVLHVGSSSFLQIFLLERSYQTRLVLHSTITVRTFASQEISIWRTRKIFEA